MAWLIANCIEIMGVINVKRNIQLELTKIMMVTYISAANAKTRTQSEKGLNFHNSRSSLKVIMKFIRYWCAGFSDKQCLNLMLEEVSSNSVYLWYQKSREIVS